MAVEKLLGLDDTTIDTNHGNDTFVLSRFQAIKQGVMSEFRVKCTDAVNVKVAIYADNSGEPENLITANNTGQACATGWNTLTIGDTNIVSGTYYWLAIIAETAGKVGVDTDAGTMRYKAGTYSTWSFPNPAGEGFNSASYQTIEAGWGESSIYIMDVEVGQFAITGKNVNLSRPIINMFVEVGEFTLTGINVGLTRGWNMAVSVGQFILTGINILFTGFWKKRTKPTTNWTKKDKSSDPTWKYKDKL